MRLCRKYNTLKISTPIHLNPLLQNIPFFSFELGQVGGSPGSAGADGRATRKGGFQGCYNPVPSGGLPCMVLHSRLRRMSAPKRLQLQPWEVCVFRKLLSSAVLPRRQELNGRLERLKEEASIALLVCFNTPKEEVKITRRRFFE